ncbi:hypothetical protein P7V44_11180 [Providencia sp. CRE-3FA-0001]|uniref:Uncharacterized protein n=4 Tax=Providencia TaxID=586 RepID=A0AA42FLV0_9GAMM|nr:MULTISPECIES: hypothetical protein [Providencia]EJD6411499.1 hypothetical protein [Providencia rettgeri]EJD6663288.1 hypothetical protein [Providencia rettgeri]ELR5095058.1 hypothetical protein [Providencia rettgeri]ELR5173613.1 hypothetical protein [Providencia rettgeri]ELR5196401.1 hypothetical protein [Providencia rettgeri]
MKTTPLDTTTTSSLYRKNSSTGAKKETPTITQKIKNLKINNPFSFFHFNKKNTESKFYISLPEAGSKGSDLNLLNKLNSNKKTISSLENKLINNSFNIPQFIKDLKNKTENSIDNLLGKNDFFSEIPATDKIIEKQNETIGYLKHYLDLLDKNKKLTNKSEELKNEIDDLKSAIRYESKIRGIAYLKKESKYLVSLEKEIPMENNIEGKNKKIEKLIKIQNSVKILLSNELKDIKNKVHNITLDKNALEKNILALKKPIICESFITYDEDNTPIYHNESHDFDFDDLFEKKLETENTKNNRIIKNLILENDLLYNSIEELDNDNLDYRGLVQDLRIDNNNKNHEIRALQEKLANKVLSMASISLTSLSSGYHSDNEDNNLTSDLKVSEEKIAQKEETLKNKYPLANNKGVKKYLYTHKVQCLAAGIPISSSKEQLQARLKAIKIQLPTQ